VLKHKFFSDLDLPDLRKIKPPFVPQLDSDTDMKYFETEDERGLRPTVSYEELKKITEDPPSQYVKHVQNF